MIIKNLNIRDFGIFENSKLEDISPSLVVIGGFNRSGKTSFMQALKHIPYGFTKGESIPSAKVKYEIYSDILLENENMYRIYIDGYKKPQVSLLNEKAPLMSIEEIYNNIDFFTYDQLFTITLDQLNNIYDGDNERLQAVLLGAGVKEIIKIPGIIDDFKKEASKIGRTQGKPNTGSFKSYNTVIKENKDIRKKALGRLEEYMEKMQKIKEVEENLKHEEEEFNAIKEEVIKLDLLKSSYEDYKGKEELHQWILENNLEEEYTKEFIEEIKRLNSEYENISDKYNEKVKYYIKEVNEDINYMYKFLKSKDVIKDKYRKLYGIKERITSYIKEQKSLMYKKQELVKNIKGVNNNWNSFEDITSIQCDEVWKEVFEGKIRVYDNLKKEIESKESQLERIKLQNNSFNDMIGGSEKEKSSSNNKKYFLVSIGVTLISFIICLINYKVGIIFLLFGLSGIIAYFMLNKDSNKGKDTRKNIIKEIKRLDSEENIINVNLQKSKVEVRKIDETFKEYAIKLKLPQNISPHLIKDYLKSALNFKKNIIDIYNSQENLKDGYGNLKEDMLSVNRVVEEIQNKDLSIIENSTEWLEKVDEEFNIIMKNLDASEEFHKIIIEKTYLENNICKLLNIQYEGVSLKKTSIKEENLKAANLKEIINVQEKIKVDLSKELNKVLGKIEIFIIKQNKQRELEVIDSEILGLFKSQRIRQAFHIYEDQRVYENLDTYYSCYESLEEIEEQYLNFVKIQKEKENFIEELKETKQNLKYEVHNLYSEDDLEKAQEAIYNTRKSLRPLAEKYAVNSSAVFLLEKVYRRLLQDAKDNVLGKASSILDKVTSGEYKEIFPPEDLSTLDFNTTSKHGKDISTPSVLSRGTKEQLFFSVRLSRIEDVKPPLPVILDDCFVNFDASHVRNTVEVLKEISKTHQVFFLTCHSHMIDCILNNIESVQYWKLEKGNFNEAKGQELRDYLLAEQLQKR